MTSFLPLRIGPMSPFTFCFYGGLATDRSGLGHSSSPVFLNWHARNHRCRFFFGTAFSNFMLTASLFFAFDPVLSDLIIYFAYILLFKGEMDRMFSAALLLLQIITGFDAVPRCRHRGHGQLLALFGPEIVSQARNRRQVTARRKRFEIQSHDSDAQALHRCAICGGPS